MKIQQEGLDEIKCRGKDIIFTYATREFAYQAWKKGWDKTMKDAKLKKLFNDIHSDRLTNVIYAHTNNMNDTQKKKFNLPNDYVGIVAIESWNVDGKLELRYKCVKSVVDYIQGFW